MVLTVQQQGTKRILSLGANLSPTFPAGPTDKKVRSDIIEINGSSQSQVVLTPIDSRPTELTAHEANMCLMNINAR